MKTKLTVKISIYTKSKLPILTADLLFTKTNRQSEMIGHDSCTSGTL